MDPDYGDPALNQIAGVSPTGADFAGRIAKLRSDLSAKGVETNVISGYRSPEKQAQLQRFPQGYPVAAPGASFHNFAAAVDLVPVGDYASGNAAIGQMASDPARGLTWGGNWKGSQRDPNHIQLGGVTLSQLQNGTNMAKDGSDPEGEALLKSFMKPAPAASADQGQTDSAGQPIVPGQDIIVQKKTAAPVDDEGEALLKSMMKPAALTPIPTPAPASMTPTAVAASPSKVVPGAVGQNGLVWDANGGHDPKTGELVIAGKPMSEGQNPFIAATSGVLNGVPIAGPALVGGVQRAVAGANALRTNTPYDQNLSALQAATDRSYAANPMVTTGANIIGGVLGTGAAMTAAPGLFGVGGAGLLPSSVASGLTGAAIGGVDAGVRSGNFSPTFGSPMARGAIAGGLFGTLAPGAGKLIGAGINAASNALANVTPAARNVAGVLGDIGMSVQDSRNALTRMGPQAALADIDPALTTEAGGLASMGGAPTSILRGAMRARAAQADNRVSAAIDQSLGPKPDLTAAKEAIYHDAQTSAAPYYNAARASAGPMDVTPILNDINSQLENAVGGEAAVLNKARAYLTGANGPKTDPSALLKVRQALDDDLESLQRNGSIDGTSAGQSAFRAASNVRGQIDDVLKTDPNIAQGDANFAYHMQLKDAMDEGTQLFTKGVRPEDFQRTLANSTPEQIDAYRQGARVAIGDALEASRRGELSGAQSMFGRASANRAKLDALFPGTDDVFDMIHGETAMRATEHDVAQNSRTAERQAVRAKYSPGNGLNLDATAPLVGHALGGDFGTIAATGGRLAYGALRDALTRSALNRLTEGTARGLAAGAGPEQSQFLDQLTRAAEIHGPINALARGAGAATNLLIRTGGPAAVNALSSP